MPIIRNTKIDFEIYENQSEGILVAINRVDVDRIKAYSKKHKGKKNAPREKVNGNPFVLDEEFDSLKVDYTTTKSYFISELQKFKG